MIALQLLAWAAAFATALWLHARRSDEGPWRLATGLWVGGWLAHAGWAALNAPIAWRDPARALEPGTVSVLFVPLGVLLFARTRAALASLPLALAVARLGCLPADGCYAEPGHALPELVGLVALHVGATRRPDLTAPIVLSGFGALRLLTLPLRAPTSVEALWGSALVACGWIVLGLALRDRLDRLPARAPDLSPLEPVLRALFVVVLVALAFVSASLLWGDAAWVRPTVAGLALAVVLVARRAQLSLAPRRVGALALLVGACIGVLALPEPRIGSPSGVDVLALVILVPTLEEMLYRERLLLAVEGAWGPVAAAIASSAAFALMHPTQAAAHAFAGGLVVSAIALRTRSLAAPIGLHAGWNLAALC